MNTATVAKNAQRHAERAATAAYVIGRCLDGTDGYTDDERPAIILAAAKELEAAGCYIRRKSAAGIL